MADPQALVDGTTMVQQRKRKRKRRRKKKKKRRRRKKRKEWMNRVADEEWASVVEGRDRLGFQRAKEERRGHAGR